MYCSFEDLEVWQSSVDLCTRIYYVLKNCRDFGFKDQICRASVSIPSNIAEGIERNSEKETIQYLHISKGSCAEVRTQLIIAYKIEYIKNETFTELQQQAKSISCMLHGLINYRSQKPLTPNP